MTAFVVQLVQDWYRARRKGFVAVNTVKLTNASMERLTGEAGKSKSFFRDATLPQLQVRVTEAGTKTFFVKTWSQAQQKTVSITIGTYPGVSITRAREIARRHLDEIASGHDPHDIRRALKRDTLTLSQVMDEYLSNRSLKENTVKDYRRHLGEGLADFRNMRVIDISEVLVQAAYIKGTKQSGARANGAMRVLRLLMNYVMANYRLGGKPIIEKNPVVVLSDKKAWKPAKRRNSVIRQESLKDWWQTVEKMRAISPITQMIADYLQLILLTGIRPGHLETMAKERHPGSFGYYEQKSGVFVVSPKFTQEFEIDIPLSDTANDIVTRAAKRSKNVWIFPASESDRCIDYDSVKHWVSWIRRESGVDFIPMDLRRTFATIAESLDLSPYTIKRLMGQITSDQADVTAGYIILQHSRVRAATQKITDTIMHFALS